MSTPPPHFYLELVCKKRGRIFVSLRYYKYGDIYYTARKTYLAQNHQLQQEAHLRGKKISWLRMIITLKLFSHLLTTDWSWVRLHVTCYHQQQGQRKKQR